MKTRSFFGGLSWLLFLNFLIKPAWIFFIDRKVQNTVGYQAYGTYFALFNLTYVLSFLTDAGLTNYLTQSIAAGAKVPVRQVFRAKGVLLLMYALLCFLVGGLSGVGQWTVLFYLVLIQSLSSVFLFLRGLLTASQLFKTDALFSVLDKTLMLLFCAGPVYGFIGRISVLLFLQLQLIATSLSVVALFVLCWRKRLFLSTAPKQRTVQLLKATAPFLLIVLLMATHYRLDGFLLERLHPDGATQAGIYASAYRLLDAGNMLGYLCASFLAPFVAKHKQEKKTIEGVALTLRHGLLFTGIAVATFATVFAMPLQRLLYHTNYAYNGQVIALCLAVLPAYYLVHVYGSLLTAVAAFRLFIYVLIVSVFINAVLNFLLIPSLGAVGCCVAALVSQYGCALALWVAASRRLVVALSLTSFVLYLGWAAVCFLFLTAIKTSGNALWIILAAASFVAALLALKARWRQFISLLNA